MKRDFHPALVVSGLEPQLLVIGHPAHSLDLDWVFGVPCRWNRFVADDESLFPEGQPIGSGRQRWPWLVRLGLIPKGDAGHKIVTLDEAAVGPVGKCLRTFVLDFGSK